MINNSKKFEILAGGVTAAIGFSAASYAAGIKYQGRDDMAMIYSSVPAVTAGTFTTNLVKAAPVLWDKQIIDNYETSQAVVINSGIANACTGQEGLDCCWMVADEAREALGLGVGSVLVASTGVIGKQLPVLKLRAGVRELSGRLGTTLEHGTAAEKAIMTTDTKPKEVAVRFTLGEKTVTIGGMCKGSGMIHPNMCTMLAFITSDIAISKELLNKALRADIQDTFNMISVDGDTSTNDTVILMANGLAGNPEITAENEDYDAFCQALHIVTETLAKKIAGDGEGCTALLEVKVVNASDKETAKTLAKSVVCSSLTKAAIYGHDANWGRILCALGYSGAKFDPDKTDLYFISAAGKLRVVENGMATDYSEEFATKILSEPEVTVIADVHDGKATATAWGCDLTYDYVKINADYRS
ncbi:MAG: bifunctional glutamate N-acetyltransferase/amino-acid acetyltransferase ArgJ [Oscillospiraceae bacterium]|nr:bifunctional glutamate N-acetyltransferase/amino-acid acetyltransferase ArgJ [Oscillospiraceae bacterium]